MGSVLLAWRLDLPGRVEPGVEVPVLPLTYHWAGKLLQFPVLYRGDSNGIFLSDLLQEFKELMYVKYLGQHLGSAPELLAIIILNQKLGQNVKIMLL